MGRFASIFGRLARPRLMPVLCCAVFVVLAASMWSPAAHADNTLTSTTPTNESNVATSPSSLLMVFTDPLGSLSNVTATCDGNPFSLGSATVGVDGRSLSIAVPNPMPKGNCVVVAKVSTVDGSPNGSPSFSFTITEDTTATTATTAAASSDGTGASATSIVQVTPTAPSTDDAAPPNVAGPLGLARVISTLGLATLLGALVLIATAWPEGVEYILTVRFLRTAWILGLVGSILMVILLTAQVTGKSVGASLSPLAWSDLTDSTPGLAAVARVAFAAGCGWVVIRPERSIDQATQLPAFALPVLAVATFGLSRTGGDLNLIGIVMGIGHALAMAVWLGGVVLLARVVLAGPGEDDLVHAVRGFSRISTPALLITVVTGAVQTYRLDSGTLFSSGHGRVLLLKALAVGAMVFVGLATRQFVRARLSKVDSMSAPLASRLRRATTMEAAGGVVVLALSSWLLALVPGGLIDTGTSRGDFGYIAGRIVTTDEDLDLTVSITGVVGPNALRVDVVEPTTGLTGLVIQFTPPEGSSVSGVVLTVPTTLSGAGAAELPLDQGIPLGAPGVWTMTVTAMTANGERTGQRSFNLLSD